VVHLYAPLPAPTLSDLVHRLRAAAPQWQALRRPALQRALARLAQAEVGGLRWLWPADENPAARRYAADDDELRLLGPFDPVVWDRRRFERFWGWPYRFEAYVPAPQRVRGYYALPLLWRDDVSGWANLAVRGDALEADIGWHTGRPPPDAAWQPALAAELTRCARFLGLADDAWTWRPQR
jgi:uncharacterized protein YcaQ